MSLKEELKLLHQRIKEALSLANEGLLKSEKFYELECDIKSKLKDSANKFDERTQALIDKTISKSLNWISLPKSGAFIGKDKAEKQLIPLLDLIEELLKVIN